MNKLRVYVQPVMRNFGVCKQQHILYMQVNGHHKSCKGKFFSLSMLFQVIIIGFARYAYIIILYVYGKCVTHYIDKCLLYVCVSRFLSPIWMSLFALWQINIVYIQFTYNKNQFHSRIKIQIQFGLRKLTDGKLYGIALRRPLNVF